MNLEAYSAEKVSKINDSLKVLLQPNDSNAAVLYAAMNYSVFAGGKRLRPLMFLAVLDTLGEKCENYLPFAAALEMMHTYSLIHDDLPAMDDDDMRRGRPTCHKVYGEAQAILAGDALLTHAFCAMLQIRPFVQPDKLLQAIDEVAYLMGLGGMVAGQSEDITAEGKSVSIEKLRLINMQKTGAAFTASIISAAILAGATREEMDCLSRYSECLGLAYQITDDILDVIGEEEVLGKSINSDAKNNKTTYPLILGIDASRTLAESAVEEAVLSLEPLGEKANILREMTKYFLPQRQK